ncbi:hypothetical protein [Haliangium sp. UPWRP_2]|uniref:hypothetical protein n=1 Tax=Haliangium sp. UPWRP_2 TaxID=1931276 RepID=UPI000D0C97E0|nr:hypothetical protein [Haliangium sp. UPWRP_2]PSM30969.1 hypothetical protein BVG81_007785 [Haliangium sp. UPWRP_2]
MLRLFHFTPRLDDVPGLPHFAVQILASDTVLLGALRLNRRVGLGEERADNPLDYLIRIRKIALPLYPQYGTEPNVYYIPPIHVPISFTQQMFGPGVEAAMQTYRSVPNDPDLLSALLLFGNTPRILHRFRRDGQEAVGYDDKDQEVVRVPFTEPFFTRDFFDKKNDVYRHNIT